MTAMASTRLIDRYLDHDAAEAFCAALDDLRRRTRESLGDSDLRYIRRLIRRQRALEYGGRAAIHAGVLLPPLWVAGVAALAAAKILDNMEIGHNILHGQYDWSGDPRLDSRRWRWNLVCPEDQWRHSHNQRHHRYTNIVGIDRDIGYGLLRLSEAQPWGPCYLLQPLAALGLCLTFEWGIAVHDLELEKRILARQGSWRERLPALRALLRKARRKMAVDYVVFPLLAGPFFPAVAAGNLSANLLRNIWAFVIIFCGHFPEGVAVFTPAECRGEQRAQWYLRQLLGSCNIEGGRWLQLMSGHLSQQIEHHLFPGIPAHRYPALAVEVRALCRRYGLPYHTGSLGRQFGSVVVRLLRLWLPLPRTAAAAA